MHFLVAGGAGFLGSHLVDKIVSQGHSVDILDNFSTGYAVNVQGVASEAEERVKIVLCDVSVGIIDCHEERKKYDVVCNLASPASPEAYRRLSVETIMTNVVGTKNLLDVAKTDGAVYVQASTSEVYGDPLEHPQAETYLGNVNSYGPRANYDESKRCTEALCYEYRSKGFVDARVARIFNTYGERMDPYDGRVISNFVRQAIEGKPLTIYGDGSQTRSFCHVSDMVDALWKLSIAETWEYGPVNLGNDKEFTINELARVVGNFIPTLEVVHEELPKNDPKRRKPNIALAREKLGYEPTVSLEQGVARTFSWMKEILR